MKERYRIGIVGSGFGVHAHLPALIAHPRFDVVALASPNRAASVAKERNIAHAFTDAKAMLAGVELDAIVIASPPFTHRDDVLAALAAGKHVMCEKPFALDVAQAEEMLAASERAGTACGVAHEFRFVPERRALQQMVANGHLSPTRTIEVTQYASFLRAESHRKRGWWFEREKGGGIAGALLSHLIDSANWTIGRTPSFVQGFKRIAIPQRRDDAGEFTSTVDDGAAALLQYGDGIIGRISVEGTTAVESFTIAVHGADRTAVASGPNIADTKLFAVTHDDTEELDCKPSPYQKFESINPNVPLLMELYDEFATAMDGEPAPLLPTFAESVETMRVLDALQLLN